MSIHLKMKPTSTIWKIRLSILVAITIFSASIPIYQITKAGWNFAIATSFWWISHSWMKDASTYVHELAHQVYSQKTQKEQEESISLIKRLYPERYDEIRNKWILDENSIYPMAIKIKWFLGINPESYINNEIFAYFCQISYNSPKVIWSSLKYNNIQDTFDSICISDKVPELTKFVSKERYK